MFVICKCFARFFMNTNSNALEFQVGIVVKCFQSERSSDQSLQFLCVRPHQNYNFISVSGRFSRIFCLFFMTRIQFPRKRSTLAEVSVSGSRQTRPLFYPVRQLDHVCRVDAEEDIQDFRPFRPGPEPPPQKPQ